MFQSCNSHLISSQRLKHPTRILSHSDNSDEAAGVYKSRQPGGNQCFASHRAAPARDVLASSKPPTAPIKWNSSMLPPGGSSIPLARDERTLSDAHIEAMIDRAASKAAEDAVSAAFRALGVDISSPANLRDWHADAQWTRSAREGSGKLSLSIKTTLGSSLATAIIYALWTMFRAGPPASM